MLVLIVLLIVACFTLIVGVGVLFEWFDSPRILPKVWASCLGVGLGLMEAWLLSLPDNILSILVRQFLFVFLMFLIAWRIKRGPWIIRREVIYVPFGYEFRVGVLMLRERLWEYEEEEQREPEDEILGEEQEQENTEGVYPCSISGWVSQGQYFS